VGCFLFFSFVGLGLLGFGGVGLVFEGFWLNPSLRDWACSFFCVVKKTEPKKPTLLRILSNSQTNAKVYKLASLKQ
jgi:hypothetical protein